MLAGNWPHWNPQDIKNHPDELLRARLECADPSKSLVEQDLVQLAEGLEGRSTNPVSLLVSQYKSHFRPIFIAYFFFTLIDTSFRGRDFFIQCIFNVKANIEKKN